MAGRPSPLRRLAPCLVTVVAAHATLLALPVRPAAASGATALQVRMIEAVPQRETPVVSLVESGPTLAPIVARKAQVVPQQTPAQAAQQSPADTPTPNSPVPVIAPSGWALGGVADDDDLYLTRSLLTVAPAPLAPVLIRYPDLAGVDGRYIGELTLFIDETGTVVRVRCEDNALPPALEEAARNAFMSVRFQPGELADHGAVKSRIRVEVVFEGGAPLQIG